MTRKKSHDLPTITDLRKEFDIQKKHWKTIHLFRKLDLLYRIMKGTCDDWTAGVTKIALDYKEDPKLLREHVKNVRKYIDQLIGHEVLLHGGSVTVMATIPGAVQVAGDDRKVRTVEDVEFLNEVEGRNDD